MPPGSTYALPAVSPVLVHRRSQGWPAALLAGATAQPTTVLTVCIVGLAEATEAKRRGTRRQIGILAVAILLR
jgi:hypothetical protein